MDKLEERCGELAWCAEAGLDLVPACPQDQCLCAGASGDQSRRMFYIFVLFFNSKSGIRAYCIDTPPQWAF